jgi:TatD DNase family protein
MFVDIHTHSFIPATDPAIRNLTFDMAGTIAASDEKGFFSAGIHPWQAGEYSAELFKKITAWTADSRFVAIGECGLDKHSKSPLEIQATVFEQHILLSERLQKPLIIHCVGCFNELFAFKKKMNPRQLWIIHGFRGKPELAGQALKAGCALSFGEYFNPGSVRLTPTDRLYIETDESTVPVSEIYHSIALIKQCDPEELSAGEKLIKRV